MIGKGELIKTIFISLAASFVVLAILYFVRLRYISNFIPKYGFYLFFAVLSYSPSTLSLFNDFTNSLNDIFIKNESPI